MNCYLRYREKKDLENASFTSCAVEIIKCLPGGVPGTAGDPWLGERNKKRTSSWQNIWLSILLNHAVLLLAQVGRFLLATSSLAAIPGLFLLATLSSSHQLLFCSSNSAQNPTALFILCTAKTKYRNFETTIHRKGISGFQSQFPHSCVCERFIYSHDQSAYSAGGNM
jgi:hypothetical protein